MRICDVEPTSRIATNAQDTDDDDARMTEFGNIPSAAVVVGSVDRRTPAFCMAAATPGNTLPHTDEGLES
jgi:hypothetical protein